VAGGKKNTGTTAETLIVPRSGGGRLSVLLAHPSSYAVGMSSLGYQTVWRIINDIPGVYVERAFAGDAPDKPSKSFESGRHAAEFDIVAFSLSYEPEAVGLVRFLKNSGIPTGSRKRHARDPLVIAGGIVPTLNPEPYADFIDLFVIGEAEEALPELINRLTESRKSSRTKLLAEAAEVPGVYAPGLYELSYGDGLEIIRRDAARHGVPEVVQRRWVADLDKFPARSAFVAPDSEFGDMGLVEVTRGCGRGCRFCAAGHIMRPPRYRSVESLSEDVRLLSEHFDCIGLVSSSVTDHPGMDKLLDLIEEAGVHPSFASLPIDGLSDKLLDAAAKRTRTLTMAPETGSERLRKLVNKKFDNEEVAEAARRAAEKGIKRIKMYFLVGLPTECGEDVAAIPELVRGVSKAIRKAKKNVELVAAVAPFVPKANTPFAIHPMEDAKAIESRMAEVRGAVRKIPNAVARTGSVPEALFQALLARGDRRAAKMITRVIEEGGSIRKAMRKPPDWARDALYTPRTVDQPVPWDFIDARIGTGYLIDEYHQGLLERTSPPCNPPKCTRCNACR